MRVKSLTPPLPSVLPITAITSSAPNLPAAINPSRPLASWTVFSSTFATSIAIRWKLSLLASFQLFVLSHPRPVFAAQHLFIALAAVNHGRGYISRLPRSGPERRRRDLVDHGPLAFSALPEHHTIIRLGAGQRNPALDDIAQHQFQFAPQRVAPAAAAGRHHANHLPFQDRLAIDQAAEVITPALGIDGDAE